MSIATELSNYQNFLTNAYNKCADKGATIPQYKNLQNLTACIDSIPSYTELDYIESTGTQYINTGYAPNNSTKVVFEGYLADANVLLGCGLPRLLSKFCS